MRAAGSTGSTRRDSRTYRRAWEGCTAAPSRASGPATTPRSARRRRRGRASCCARSGGSASSNRWSGPAPEKSRGLREQPAGPTLRRSETRGPPQLWGNAFRQCMAGHSHRQIGLPGPAPSPATGCASLSGGLCLGVPQQRVSWPLARTRVAVRPASPYGGRWTGVPRTAPCPPPAVLPVGLRRIELLCARLRPEEGVELDRVRWAIAKLPCAEGWDNVLWPVGTLDGRTLVLRVARRTISRALLGRE